jgi:hypothetical protein
LHKFTCHDRRIPTCIITEQPTRNSQTLLNKIEKTNPVIWKQKLKWRKRVK